MPKSLIVSLDLEMNQPSGRIIQIGAVVGDVRTGEVLSRFDAKVSPGEPLNPEISTLTGIKAAELADAPMISEAGQALVSWVREFDADRVLNPLTWGGGDTETLRRELGWADARWPFGRRWIDVKTLFVAWRMAQGKDIAGGLARAMTKLKLSFEGRKHDAVDDAYNTFRMYRALLAEFQPRAAGSNS